MEFIKNSYQRELTIAIEQIANHYGFKLQISETQILVRLLREVQDSACLEANTQIEDYHLVSFLSYINSLLGAIAQWESKQTMLNLKLCQNFLVRVIAIPQSQEKLILCYELVKIFCHYQLEYCDQVIEIIAELEKFLLKNEANSKGMQLCPSCDKITKEFKAANDYFCGFCGHILVP